MNFYFCQIDNRFTKKELKFLMRSLDYLDEFRSKAEDRMFSEFPLEAEKEGGTHIFYPAYISQLPNDNTGLIIPEIEKLFSHLS